uniref:Uncharacterized protein n=1 Tax=Cacopsylla melanoneura TaxID=428564 RepID=A0A8D8X6B8_9HEMI
MYITYQYLKLINCVRNKGLRHRILAPPGEQLHADRRLHADPLAARELPTTNNAPVLGSKQNTRWALLRFEKFSRETKVRPPGFRTQQFLGPYLVENRCPH